MISLKERVTRKIEQLPEDQLRMVEEYLAFLLFRARARPKIHVNRQQLAALYAEAAEEDRTLTEEGMADYWAGLQQEEALGQEPFAA